MTIKQLYDQDYFTYVSKCVEQCCAKCFKINFI